MRLYQIIDAVPFPASGTKSSTAQGMMLYWQDMISFVPALKAVLYGMACEGYDQKYEWQKGDDYDDPDILLDAIEDWIEMRKREGWGDHPYSFDQFWKDAKAEMMGSCEAEAHSETRA